MVLGQPTKHKLFLNIARTISQESKCVSHKVGCVIVRDSRIISMGYNGTPAGYTNCNDINWTENDDHHTWSKKFEIHAEINAILFAAKNGVCINNSTLYCTLQPCNDCLKALTQSGIKQIYYSDTYKRTEIDEEILKMLDIAGVKLIQYEYE